jgi:hypothetical protein
MSWNSSWGEWKHYGVAARRHVHQLLAWGYTDARPKIKREHDETDITGLIAEAIQDRLNGTAPRRYDRYSVADDAAEPGEGRTGKSRRRADIVVERSGTRPRLRYILEAKRLRRGSHQLSKYLGSDGLGRFVRGSYAPHALEAAMVAYVQTPSVADWEAELAAAFAGAQRATLSVSAGLAAEVVVTGLPHSWVSTHARAKGPQITIFHILLDCCVPSTPASSS